MADKKDNGKNLERYDYLEKKVNSHFEIFYTEYYPCFGWVIVKEATLKNRNLEVHIAFRRKFDIAHKMELLRLQAKFDSCMEELRNLEIAKVFGAVAAAVMLGLLGIGFMIGAIMLSSIYGVLGGVLAIPAMGGWLMAFPCYRMIKGKKQKVIQPLIDEKYEELYQISLSAYQLTSR